MPSAAEQMAANLSWNSFGKAKDLQRRIFYALGLLIVYRIGTYIPVPGIDASQLRSFFEQANTGIGGMLKYVHRRSCRKDGYICSWYNALYHLVYYYAAFSINGPSIRTA